MGHPAAPQIAFIEGNAQALPSDTFPDNTYDLYTIAFGIRNVTSIPDVLREAHRVLKPGGVFACLEFNRVTNPLLAQYGFPPFPISLSPFLTGGKSQGLRPILLLGDPAIGHDPRGRPRVVPIPC
jgi:2-methoxy-6-polyprenyl-1,4-benzoquinol methylase